MVKIISVEHLSNNGKYKVTSQSTGWSIGLLVGQLISRPVGWQVDKSSGRLAGKSISQTVSWPASQ